MDKETHKKTFMGASTENSSICLDGIRADKRLFLKSKSNTSRSATDVLGGHVSYYMQHKQNLNFKTSKTSDALFVETLRRDMVLNETMTHAQRLACR